MDARVGPIGILHVDDQPDFLEMAAVFLERADERFNVVTATSASEALERLAEHEFDCVISDYDMPKRDGIELLEDVREEYPELPFILFTGKGSEEVASGAISSGVTDYLQKESGTDQYAILANRILNYVERAEARREQERHHHAIETASEGISILDEDGYFRYVNPAYADLYGYERDELVGEHWSVLYPESDIEVTTREIESELADRGEWHGETTGLRKDGTTFVEDHTISMTSDGEMVCTVRDVTEQTRYIRRLETLIDNLPGMVYRCENEPGWPMENVRGEVETLTGYEPGEIENREGIYGDEIIHPDDQSAVWEDVQAGLDADGAFEITYCIVTKCGEVKRVWERGQGVYSADGELEAIEGFITAIAERATIPE